MSTSGARCVWLAVVCLAFAALPAIAQDPAPAAETPAAEAPATPAAEAPAAAAAEPAAAEPIGSEPAKPEGTSTLVTNMFFDTDLRQALSDVSAQTGVIVIPTEDVMGLISMDLKDMPIEEALDLMCLPGGYVHRKIKDNIYLVGSSDPSSRAFMQMAEVKVVQLEYLTGKELQSRVPPLFEKYCTFDESGNQVTITAPEALLERISKTLEALDQPVEQLMIEALVVETSAGKITDFRPHGETKFLEMDAATGLMTYTDVASDVLARVYWLITNNEAQTKANPSVVAQEGRTAKVEVATEQYFTIVTGPVSYPYTTLQQIDATIGLEITPILSDRTDDVTVMIKPTVSNVTGQGANQLPIITKRTVETTVRVRDGQVIAIGGLLETVETTTKAKIPILGDIPLIGELFRTTNRNTNQREVVVFIVPHRLEANGSFRGPRLLELAAMAAHPEGLAGVPHSESASGTAAVADPGAAATSAQVRREPREREPGGLMGSFTGGRRQERPAAAAPAGDDASRTSPVGRDARAGQRAARSRGSAAPPGESLCVRLAQ